ncbi:MAG: hypothetical protein ACR2MX_12765 [Cyclobacteriaceae bacterium]
MIVDFLLVGFLFYLTIPLVAGYSAHCYGRSFWVWFTLGAIFPAVAHLALALLVKDDSFETLSEREDQYMSHQINKVMGEIQLNSNNY